MTLINENFKLVNGVGVKKCGLKVSKNLNFSIFEQFKMSILFEKLTEISLDGRTPASINFGHGVKCTEYKENSFH